MYRRLNYKGAIMYREGDVHVVVLCVHLWYNVYTYCTVLPQYKKDNRFPTAAPGCSRVRPEAGSKYQQILERRAERSATKMIEKRLERGPPLEIARHPILKGTCKRFALPLEPF